ncbi:hypothetical protein PY365_12210 [Roseiarcaceae bacterium H3SJ34-1]|uniref:hypothetical protein n=1 Tax=Terripilifer ovatus TaxID=3032367 RepID=UPI003AB98DA6|nr:hypothetical protein [Roseiarcaceae bacterium H3SJ34-1]
MCRRLHLSPLRLALTLLLAIWSGAHAAAQTQKPENVIGAMAFLLRVHDGACPGISFDPFQMSKMIDPKGLSLQAVRHRYGKDFNESYKEAGSRIASEGLPAYCNVVRSFFGKTPGEFPGLKFQ